MTLLLTERADLRHIAEIRADNDRFRANPTGGWLIFSAGLITLGAAVQGAILTHVRTFKDFDADDPWDTHDIGDFEIEVGAPAGEPRCQLVFFRIVDLATAAGATKALVLMLASEW